MLYQKKDGLKFIMEDKEHSGINGEFPSFVPNGKASYTEIFKEVEEYMNTEVHKNVVIGAAIAGDGLLNDHGKEHIAMVMERAMLILGEKAIDLRGYEIFFLLLAIHFHDVGNVLGREEHEQKIGDILSILGDKLPLDYAVKRVIILISMAHGGVHEGDKDTLAYLEELTYVDSIPIRTALIASILRFSDEIADDKNRANNFMRTIHAIPGNNTIFHEYSRSLEPPVREGNTLILQYNIRNDVVDKKISKLDEEVYLYDEILTRIQKCLCELDYCKRYAQGFISLSYLSVTIHVLDAAERRIVYKDRFKLRITGYPSKDLFNPILCSEPKIRAKDAVKLIKMISPKENDND